MSERVRVPIEVMTCTSCAARITKAVRKVTGVASVRVDLGSDSATVAFDRPASVASIADAIRGAGYEPAVERVTAQAEEGPRTLLAWLLRR